MDLGEGATSQTVFMLREAGGGGAESPTSVRTEGSAPGSALADVVALVEAGSPAGWDRLKGLGGAGGYAQG